MSNASNASDYAAAASSSSDPAIADLVNIQVSLHILYIGFKFNLKIFTFS